jgi:hypothetical protein
VRQEVYMYSFDILVNERPVKKYYDNKGQIWIEGRPDSSFSIKVSNNGYGRILSVISVDGLNVINAKHEDPWDSRGYIVNSYSNIVIPGWKISENDVKKFYFTSNDTESYARKIGADEKNIGVLAMAVFSEKLATYNISWTNNPYNIPLYYSSKDYDYGSQYTITCCANSCESFTGSLEASAETVSNSVSVGSGSVEEYKTKTIEFERNKLEKIIVFYYDTFEGLKKRGIIQEDSDYRKKPKPFPNFQEFCPAI